MRRIWLFTKWAQSAINADKDWQLDNSVIWLPSRATHCPENLRISSVAPDSASHAISRRYLIAVPKRWVNAGDRPGLKPWAIERRPLKGAESAS